MAGLQVGGGGEAWPLLGRRQTGVSQGEPAVVPLFRFNGGFTGLVVLEAAVVGYAAYNNWGLNTEYAAAWLAVLIAHLNVVGAGTRKSQKGSRASALMSGAILAAKLLTLPKLAFGVGMTWALEYEHPMNFTDLKTFGEIIDEAGDHPSTLSWGAVALATLLQFIPLAIGAPRSTPRSRFPYAEISALNCLWCLGATLTGLSCFMWLLIAISPQKPADLDGSVPTMAVLATVSGIVALLNSTLQLSSTLKGSCLVVVTNTLCMLIAHGLIAFTVYSWSTWFDLSMLPGQQSPSPPPTHHHHFRPDDPTDAPVQDSEPASPVNFVLQVALPIATCLVALYIAVSAMRCSKATIKLARERARFMQNQFGTPALRHRPTVNGGPRRLLTLPRAVYRPPGPGVQEEQGVPPRYDAAMMSESGQWGERDQSSELMEAAELMASEGMPPSYIEALADEPASYPPPTLQS